MAVSNNGRAVVMAKPRFCQIGDNIFIDACKEENHTLNNTVTDHPVEEGVNISDHVRPEPDLVTLSCFVSNTPFSEAQQKRTVQEGSVQFETTAQSGTQIAQIGDVTGRGHDTFLKLKKLRDTGALVQVITTLKTYGVSPTEGMVIQSLSIPRTSKNYDGLEWSVTLKQIKIVLNKQTREIISKDKRVPNKKHVGAQTTADGANQDSAAFSAANSDTTKNLSKSNNALLGAVGKFGVNLGAGPSQ